MPTHLIGQILGAVLPLLAVAVPLPKREPIAWPVVDPADPNRLILNHRPDRRRWPAAVFAANADLLPYVPYAAAALRGDEYGGCVVVLVRANPDEGWETFQPDGEWSVAVTEFCEFLALVFPDCDVAVVSVEP